MTKIIASQAENDAQQVGGNTDASGPDAETPGTYFYTSMSNEIANAIVVFCSFCTFF